MLHVTTAIATQVLLEALRNRLAWVLAGLTALALGLAAFIGALTLTETVQVQTALSAALLRICAVFLVAGMVVTSMAREAADKGQEMLLALPVPRAAYLFGKLGGFALAAAIPALLFGALALLVAPALPAFVWTVSLLCELWIVAAFALLCALGIGNTLAALAATLAFYLLSRIGTIDVVSALLPRLDRFTRAEWLVYGDAGLAQLAPVLGQSAIYVALLGAAALFDLYRKNV